MKKHLIGAIVILLIGMIVTLAINIVQDESEAEDKAEDSELKEIEQFSQEEKNAITLAREWEDVFDWSRVLMMENLLVERTGWEISEADAEGVLDYLDFDYEENALESAKTHLLASDYSDEELHNLLTETDGFTEGEAKYAI
ncbi:Ltp family lipoprotein [Aliicoccus persicus]|uniref:Host cell surface-exposed lipoprotein n=1 Tax=Aliicoccus persicus TaxID=930138 RepID=A0A662Z8G7_9STAP|nr:Ltp family lipoprotein [Aliicoccus persicus]SEW14607.1 Host cell surface-exposed lipoprotein [Aliicoccus persicus]